MQCWEKGRKHGGGCWTTLWPRIDIKVEPGTGTPSVPELLLMSRKWTMFYAPNAGDHQWPVLPKCCSSSWRRSLVSSLVCHLLPITSNATPSAHFHEKRKGNTPILSLSYRWIDTTGTGELEPPERQEQSFRTKNMLQQLSPTPYSPIALPAFFWVTVAVEEHYSPWCHCIGNMKVNQTFTLLLHQDMWKDIENSRKPEQRAFSIHDIYPNVATNDPFLAIYWEDTARRTRFEVSFCCAACCREVDATCSAFGLSTIKIGC